MPGPHECDMRYHHVAVGETEPTPDRPSVRRSDSDAAAVVERDGSQRAHVPGSAGEQAVSGVVAASAVGGGNAVKGGQP